MYKLIMTMGVVVAIGFAFGCGSGEDEATSASLTKAQFIKRADEICTEINQQRVPALLQWKKQHAEEEFANAKAQLDAGLRAVVGPSLRQEAEQLGTLTPPADDEAEVSRMIENLSKGSEELEQVGPQALSGPSISQYKREAAAYGLKVCRFP